MKKTILFILLIISLSLTSCGPVDFFGKKIFLENTESTLDPEKESYSLSEEIKLYYTFDLDSEKFHKHIYYVSTSILKNGKEELCDNKILIFDENGNDVTGKDLTYQINENKKITKQFTLKPQEAGNYIIFVGGYAYARKKEKGVDSYQCGHIHYLNVQ